MTEKFPQAKTRFGIGDQVFVHLSRGNDRTHHTKGVVLGVTPALIDFSEGNGKYRQNWPETELSGLQPAFEISLLMIPIHTKISAPAIACYCGRSSRPTRSSPFAEESLCH